MDEEALIMAHAEEEVVKAERNAWDEDRLVSLMNKTLDTYMDKREKKNNYELQFQHRQKDIYIIQDSHHREYNLSSRQHRDDLKVQTLMLDYLEWTKLYNKLNLLVIFI